MTRFDAETPSERRKLFADAVSAHRTRASDFLTIQVDAAEEPELEETEVDDPTPPWLQFFQQTVNVDCTDAELDRLKQLVGDYPEFRIDELETPEDAEGTNVRITARADPNRLADFFERTFQDVYGYGEEYRVWVVAV
ncbi:hypothetical protein AUR64_17025 [Haloprofundus marisrubri]|uniref:DUF7975 domain-containing protein n=1 Tax=Haloprofundus marisrubri TaxID=1514971 RepID=A0A0W1R8Z8_9EURY|nr:hypothetical protein [Haloprofundus marisrubri]KTG09476.1 hypothetical protein AUR64_17025 [Haloprofundus marisrubri]